MEILDRIKGLLTGKRRLDKISLDELRKERLRLEQIEQRISADVDDLERHKGELFAKGKDESSRRQQVVLARKIKELDAAARAKDRQLAMISRQTRIVAGLAAIKENHEMARDLGVSGIISKMDVGHLQNYVERATVEGKFQMERFAGILKAMEEPEGLEIAAEEDADTLAIVEAMQEAKSDEPGDAEAVDRGMKRVDDILRAKEELDSEAAEEEF